MVVAPVHPNEAERLEALLHCGILDTPPEASFDRLTRLAAGLLRAPMAVVSLVDEHRQWFKSRYGVELTGTPRDVSFCSHAILEETPLVVPDTGLDVRFAQNPLVKNAPGIRFYAGAPIYSPDRLPLGTLCVMDSQPRPVLSEDEGLILSDLAALVSEELRRRRVAEELVTLRRQIRASEERWQLALQGTNDGLWDYHFASNTVFYSARWKQILGYEPQELPDDATMWQQLVHPEDFARVAQLLEQHLARQTELYEAEYRMRHRLGHWVWVLARGKAVWDEEGRPLRLVGAHADIHARKTAEERLSREALTDALTGLSNRRQLTRRLASAVAACSRYGQPLCAMMGDLDRFKQVNDEFGHATGDQVLAALGRLLREALREEDIAARIGGDEFCILLPHTVLADAETCLVRIQHEFARRRFAGQSGQNFSLSVSFGVAQWQPGMDGEALLRAADRALYQAKADYRSTAAEAVPALSGLSEEGAGHGA